MKKILVASWCLLAVMLFFVSCNKKTEETVPAEKCEAANSFVGTYWMSNSTQIDTLNDTVFIFTSDVVIKFLDERNGVMFSDHRVFANNVPELAGEPLRTPFTYTLQDDSGKMTLDFGREDSLHRFQRYVESTFKFDKEANTITTFAPNQSVLNVYSEVK